MIEKLDSKMDCVEITVLGKHTECLGFDSAKEIGKKLNELVDAVNKLETMAKNTNTVLESLIEENNIHEKQIDELQMKAEPEKCKPAENCKCAKNAHKSDLEEALEGFPGLFKSNKDEPLTLETELERTRKALDVAVDMLKIMNDGLPNGNRWKWEIEKALKQITALEQKD